MLNNPAIEQNGLVKIYSLKNRAAAALGIILSVGLFYALITELSHSPLLGILFSFSSFHRPAHLTANRIFFILIGIISAFLILKVSSFPNVVISEKLIKVGWRFGGKFGLTYRHHIPWDQITQVDSGGSKMIQWSPNTTLVYHSGRIPVGRSSDLEQAVISTELGLKNYCKILTLVIERAPKAKIDPLTLQLIRQGKKNPRV